MKKFIVILEILINVILISFLVNIFKIYSDRNDMLLYELNGNEYDDVIKNKELEKENFINEIELEMDINLDGIDNYDDIMKMLEDKYNEVNNKNISLVKEKEELINQNNNLRKTYNEILEEERKRNTYIISYVPKINQYNVGYPTGCESAALRNLLKFWGVSVSMSDVVNALPKGDVPYFEDDVRYGGNPYIEFVGEPSDILSYGVYEKPIIEVANQFKPGIINGTGMSLDEVLNIVMQDRPVMVWVSTDMKVPYISKSWIYKPTGETISWMANEHSLLVVGFNNTQVIVSDSYNGEIRYFDKNVFRNRYNMYGKRALYY